MKEKKKHSSITKKFPLIFFTITIFMSFGYATVNSILLTFDGKATSKEVSGIYITEIKYLNDKDADMSNSKILSAYKTNISSAIFLSTSNSESSITYEIKIETKKEFDYKFIGIEYIIGEETYDNENIVIELNGMDKESILSKNSEKTFTLTFKYNSTAISDNELNSIINFKFEIIPFVISEYNYTGTIETLRVPYTGIYKLEVWGASGGDCSLTTASNTNKLNMSGGNGGYSSGTVELNAGEDIFIVVGGEGKGTKIAYQELEGGYNGGGSSIANSGVNHVYGSGGGATHIAKKSGLLSTLYNNKDSILIVAGGGGGSRNQPNNLDALARYGNGGAGGGLNGMPATGYGGDGTVYVHSRINGTQNGEESLFGQGQSYAGGGAGGGGYYGGYSGGSANNEYVGAGDGGSGYIGGVSNGNTIAGNLSIPTFDGTSTMIGNDGNGFAKITFIEEIED